MGASSSHIVEEIGENGNLSHNIKDLVVLAKLFREAFSNIKLESVDELFTEKEGKVVSFPVFDCFLASAFLFTKTKM